MRDDYIQAALAVIDDPTILINVVSLRVKQLRRGIRPLVVSLEKLELEDIALREIAERKISYELPSEEEMALFYDRQAPTSAKNSRNVDYSNAA